jgi:transposase
MIEIEGMNITSAANILSEIGGFDKFNSYKQLISYCGFNLRLSESGDKSGKTLISKRGNSRIRSYLFRVILPIVKHNKEFRELHNYYKTRKENPLKPMQSIVAIICKLLRILWGICKNNTNYNPQIAFKNTFAVAA